MHLRLKLCGKLQSEGYDAFVCAFTTETMQLVGGQRLQDYTQRWQCSCTERAWENVIEG